MNTVKLIFLSSFFYLPAYAQSAGKTCLETDAACNPAEVPRQIVGFKNYQEVDPFGLNEIGQQRIAQSDTQHQLKLYLATRWKPHPIYPLDAKLAEIDSTIGIKVLFVARRNQ